MQLELGKCPDQPVFELKGWQVFSRHSPILNSSEIDHCQKTLGIPMPEMIFGNNCLSLKHISSGWSITFSALDALDLVDKTGERDGLLQVAHSKEWLRSRQNIQANEGTKVEGIIKPFDWTYSTYYKGTEIPDHPYSLKKSDSCSIPLQILKQPDPILFFDEISLYEDELGENGIAMLTVKIRIMSERLLLLCRFFLRVDNVLFRIRDTRVYVEFATGQIIREYTIQEEKFSVVRSRLPLGIVDYGQYFRDSNWVSKHTKVQEKVREELYVK